MFSGNLPAGCEPGIRTLHCYRGGGRRYISRWPSVALQPGHFAGVFDLSGVPGISSSTAVIARPIVFRMRENLGQLLPVEPR